MMTSTRFPSLLLAVLATVGCADQPIGPISQNPDGDAIDELIAGIGSLPTEPPKRVEGAPSAPVNDGDYRCVSTPISEVKQYDQLLGQIGVGDVLWPSALLRGDSVASNQLTPLVLERRPVTFSVSLESLSGERSATLEHPSLSAYREAIGKILAQDLKGSAAARVYSELEEVSSEEQLAIALGASASAPMVGTVKAGFNFGNSQKRSRYLVKFFQIYYTVDVDPPAAPRDFFSDTVTVGEVAAAVGPTNPPVYVSSIAYGRQVLFTFESDVSQSELKAALDFAYKRGVEIDGSVSLTHQEVLSRTHMTAFILGGSAGEAAQASISDYDQLKTFIANGGEYTKASPGAPVAYKLSYVRDHAPVAVSYASDYQRKSCERVSQRVHVSFDKITVDSGGGDNALQLYGYVDVFGAGVVPATLFERDAQHYVEVANLGSYPTTGSLGEAVVTVKPAAGASVDIYSHLVDHNTVFADRDLGYVTTTAPFEAGWRRTLQVHHTAAGRQVTLSITLQPI